MQRTRRKLAFERLLARIFYHDSSNFVLKGGYAMELRFSSSRATKDIDLTCLHRINDINSSMEEIIIEELRQLSKIDLNDFFTFEISKAQMELENAPYGGARYSISSFIDKRLFVRFQLDIGADVIVDEIEDIDGCDWLKYCDIATPKIKMISVEQQLAEKLHAYSLPRKERVNSRVKDLIDMILLIKLKQINLSNFKLVIQKVFKTRKTHKIPQVLESPPLEWTSLYNALAAECDIKLTMLQAFEELNNFYKTIGLDK
ncbi:MAG: nucleotidyl transferase AbiEii/AbiGii toxin family protein [Parachlamydiales bacterium]